MYLWLIKASIYFSYLYLPCYYTYPTWPSAGSNIWIVSSNFHRCVYRRSVWYGIYTSELVKNMNYHTHFLLFFLGCCNQKCSVNAQSFQVLHHPQRPMLCNTFKTCPQMTVMLPLEISETGMFLLEGTKVAHVEEHLV